MKLHILAVGLIVDLAFSSPSVIDTSKNVTYNGFVRNSLDVFLGIKFKPPRPYQPTGGAIIDVTSYGHICPQPPYSVFPPLSFTNTSDISEDCLNLNIVRPNDTVSASKLPVLVWIHGGSFWFNSNREITNNPDGLILQSIENKTPIIHVALNYRLGGGHKNSFMSTQQLTSICSIWFRGV
ncbi:hypothetical protein MRB53_040923 [Persea americana]|nr:hypothetical protein MRB53_040923 [Persea americana]